MLRKIIIISMIFMSLEVAAENGNIERTRIGEWLRVSDVEPRLWAVDALFKQGGILNYQTLKLLWVSESETEVRVSIATKFKECGECRYIPGNVVEYWQQSLKLMAAQERATREQELAEIYGT